MTYKPKLIVFVRAPLLGAVKRRLAAGVGAAVAHRFYVDTTRRMLSRVGGDPRWDVVLSVTPDGAALRGRFWPDAYPRMPQGQGDLGRRMANAILRFRNRPVVLVGSDIPDLSAVQIGRAFQRLGASDFVFGPASDGGYWLVGVREPWRARHLFEAVRWSGPHALDDTLANTGKARVALLDPLDDVDDVQDWLNWRGRINSR
jgi:uncharacterized protein